MLAPRKQRHAETRAAFTGGAGGLGAFSDCGAMLLGGSPKVGVGFVLNTSDVGVGGIDVVRLNKVLIVSMVVALLQYGHVMVDTTNEVAIEV
jgi:hypothetical protein